MSELLYSHGEQSSLTDPDHRLYGGFWSDVSPTEESTYYQVLGGWSHIPEVVVPEEIERRQVGTSEEWAKLYAFLGEKGYLFHDAGHGGELIAIQLNRPIDEQDKKELYAQLDMLAYEDDGRQLHFA
jgi:hypothetical protein